MAGGGQEGGLRSGTENMAGVAALGAVLAALEDGHTFASRRAGPAPRAWRRR
jgi:cysteine sulfinate desulfinase/cysteine desulfurase-like protein